MDEDLIVVDDVDTETQPSSSTAVNGASGSGSLYGASRPKNVADRSMASTSRLRSGSNPPHAGESSDRTTRSSASRYKSQPKLKLKLSEKAAAQAPGMSFLGPYDHELDSDDEDLAFEEQFILRLPPGEDLEKLRKMVAAREISNDVWFKFKDSRRAEFHIGNSTYSAKLVDLPCIIESQKTLDNKQMFKVADICQMLVVEDKIGSDGQPGNRRDFNIDEFIWPHGITPPLHHVRKRRFRKRVNRRTIESVEQEVERLLDEDSLATEVKYDILENVNPDLSDSEFIEREQPLDAATPAMSDIGDPATPASHLGDEDDEGEDEDEEPYMMQDDGIDEELAAELEMELVHEDDDEGALGDDDDDDDEESEEDDDEDEDDEEVQARKLLNEEIRDLEAAVAKKGKEIASSANLIIKRRFEDALKKLTVDLEMKLAQRDEIKEKQRLKREGIQMDMADDTDPDNGGHEGDEEGEDDGDLFGDDPGGPIDM
ncbi:TAFII55 protein conserved region-domain-containing protein, partial [Crucibulum laeve]